MIEVNSNKFLELVPKSEELFDGTLGTWKTYLAHFKSKEDAKPICPRTYLVLKLHGKMFKKEIEHLVLVVLLERTND